MMKKAILMIFVLIMVVSVVSCGGKDYQVIIGLVTESTESGGFRVEVLDGFAEDLMQVHVDDKVKYEDGVERADIKPGVVVSFTIGDEVMESYPVQVNAKKILWTENVITAKILSAGEDAALVMIEDGYTPGMMQVWIEEETVFHRNIPKVMEKQKTVKFTIKDEVLESEPVQGFAIRFVSYE